MDGLVTIRSHIRKDRPIKSYLRRKQFHGMKYLKTHPVWESQRNPEERKKFAEILHVILDTSDKGVGIEREYGVPSFKDVKKPQVFQKAKPYTRTRKGKLERVKGYAGKGSALLAEPGVKPGDWKSFDGDWRIAKVGFKKTGPGKDDYETAVRWYVPKTSVELKEARKRWAEDKRKKEKGEEPSVIMEKLKNNPSLAEYIVKRPQSHSLELVVMAKKVLGREIHGRTY